MKESKPSAFKNWINQEVVSTLAKEIKIIYPAFETNKFSQVALQFDSLELKARVLAITESLYTYLPKDYPTSLNILVRVMQNDTLSGFALWPFSEYIAQFGLNHFDESIKAMHLLTQKFTSEFAIRPYFIKDHKKVLQYFAKFAQDKNHHVRRWVSEGSRPLLPWGLRLPIFVENPELTIALLSVLKNDPELYVRKSVANHLNDISKHHPNLVIDTLKHWESEITKSEQKNFQWIKRHALRTLIKKGNVRALALMGVKTKTAIALSRFEIINKKVKIGEKLSFQFLITSKASSKQKVVIDYVVHYLKSNGKNSPKVYKLKSVDLAAKEKVQISKSHSMKIITTTKFYPGIQQLSIQVNGKVLGTLSWTLLPQKSSKS